MSMWAGTCQLIKQTTTRDSRGVEKVQKNSRTVACNVFTISAAAYYAASAAGIHPQAVIQIRACAYSGERLVMFNGSLLDVERVERTPDFVRLTLTERVGDREQQGD